MKLSDYKQPRCTFINIIKNELVSISKPIGSMWKAARYRYSESARVEQLQRSLFGCAGASHARTDASHWNNNKYSKYESCVCFIADEKRSGMFLF